MEERPGRSCPLHYRYAPTVFATPAEVACEVLYVVGGLYGNELALNAVLTAFETEVRATHLVFNLHSAHCRKGRCGRLGPLIFQTTVSANFGHRAIGQAFTPVMRTVDSSHSLTPHRSIVDGHGLPDTFPV